MGHHQHLTLLNMQVILRSRCHGGCRNPLHLRTKHGHSTHIHELGHERRHRQPRNHRSPLGLRRRPLRRLAVCGLALGVRRVGLLRRGAFWVRGERCGGRPARQQGPAGAEGRCLGWGGRRRGGLGTTRLLKTQRRRKLLQLLGQVLDDLLRISTTSGSLQRLGALRKQPSHLVQSALVLQRMTDHEALHVFHECHQCELRRGLRRLPAGRPRLMMWPKLLGRALSAVAGRSTHLRSVPTRHPTAWWTASWRAPLLSWKSKHLRPTASCR
mmetsp:Transcript_40223/g.90388  ORF Transcript_40223/g.90388 Transcript_40223/m.90388 type:complete len:270 (+) Transcript_40223:607-1416(+)